MSEMYAGFEPLVNRFLSALAGTPDFINAMFDKLYGRESMQVQGREIDQIFEDFCLRTRFHLEGTMKAFLERAAPIKATIEKRVAEMTEDIIRLEREAAELRRSSGDNKQRELIRRKVESKVSGAAGTKHVRGQVLHIHFKQDLDCLRRTMRDEENRLISEKGMFVCQHTKGQIHLSARKVVLWPDGRYFLVVYRILTVDASKSDESQLFELLYQRPVEWVTDSVSQLSKAELEAIWIFKQGFDVPELAA